MIPYGRKFWRGIYFGGLAVLRAIIALQLNARLIVGMEFLIDSCVRGHHVSKEYWIPALGKELACQREEGNPYVYAVAVKIDAGIVVGHLPRKISAACSLFLRRSGTIVCQITGSRRPSSDLPQVAWKSRVL